MTASRILFVDDEPNVLTGLRRMLRAKRDTWDMNFVNSGAEALTFLEASPVDIIVTDMRMPGMDGAELLTEVRAKYPATVRIILSGQCDQETALRSVGPSHQFLSKPCDGVVLEDVITRALGLRSRLTSEKIQALVSSMPSLPSPPKVYMQLVELLKTTEPNVRAIATLVSNDVALTAKLLQLTRSAYFCINWNVRTPQQAIDMIGLDVLRALVLNHSVASQFCGDDGVHDVVWRESLSCAAMARTIAKDAGQSQEQIDDAFIAGLLHDAGILILSTWFADQHRTAREMVKRDGISLSEAERKVLGASHAEIGAYLFGLWGLPDAIVEPVAFHHEPAQCITRAVTPLMAVYVANQLIWLNSSDLVSEEAFRNVLDIDYLTQIGVVDRLPRWLNIRRDLDAEAEPA